MNLDIFRFPDPSGKMSKELFLAKNYEEEYNFIIKYCLSNKIYNLPFREKVYLTVNTLTKVPSCKNPNCNNKVNFKNFTIGYLYYCSNKCISSDPNIKKGKEEKSMKRFGTKTPAESIEIKDKIIKTNQKKHGHNSVMCLIETQEKSKKTLLENYGVDNPSKSKEILGKRIKSFKLSNYKETYKNTSLKKYGVEHPWMNKEVHQKSINSSKYNRDILTKILILEKLKKYPNHKLVKIDYSNLKKIVEIECPKGHLFEITRHSLYERQLIKSEICIICNPICKGISGMEISMLNFIKENYNSTIIENSRKIIKPYEIDIYLPDLKLGFEFNGLYWHSSINKDQNYHLTKYQMCQNINVNQITIWEDDWIFKNDIVKSFILNKLNKTPNKIYARNCEIKEISYNESKKFLEDSHLQGDCKSSIRLALINNDKIVSLMTLSKLRLPLQKLNKNRNKEGYYELTRFCSKLYTNVIGGASKLINYFLVKYNPSQIETYSDNLISDGNLYKSLGFSYSHNSNPGYYYAIDGVRSHRFNWRKQKLVKLGYDINKTEEEIMNELGSYRIYNAGNKKWILNLE
jgi:hypothetical protein